MNERDSGYLFRPILTGLTPGLKYYYRVELSDRTATGSFVAAPAENGPAALFLYGRHPYGYCGARPGGPLRAGEGEIHPGGKEKRRSGKISLGLPPVAAYFESLEISMGNP